MSTKEARGARFAVGVAVLGAALNANAWMEEWAPEFEATTPKMLALSEKEVRNFVSQVRDEDDFRAAAKCSVGYSLDLNGDGVSDRVIIIPWLGCGLCFWGCDAHFRVSNGANGWKETVVQGYYIVPEDLVQVAGKIYLRHSNMMHAFEKSRHNHWVYQVFSFDKTGTMICSNGDFGDKFPAVTIYYNDPRFRQIELTPRDRAKIAAETQKLITVK